MRQTIGMRLQALRKRARANAATVAEAVGCSRATLYRYESEQTDELPYKALDALAEYYGVAPGWLRYGASESVPLPPEEKRGMADEATRGDFAWAQPLALAYARADDSTRRAACAVLGLETPVFAPGSSGAPDNRSANATAERSRAASRASAVAPVTPASAKPAAPVSVTPVSAEPVAPVSAKPAVPASRSFDSFNMDMD